MNVGTFYKKQRDTADTFIYKTQNTGDNSLCELPSSDSCPSVISLEKMEHEAVPLGLTTNYTLLISCSLIQKSLVPVMCRM